MDPMENAELVPATDPRLMPEVMRHIDAGKRLTAINAYRQETGAGLQEAMQAISSITRG